MDNAHHQSTTSATNSANQSLSNFSTRSLRSPSLMNDDSISLKSQSIAESSGRPRSASGSLPRRPSLLSSVSSSSYSTAATTSLSMISNFLQHANEQQNNTVDIELSLDEENYSALSNVENETLMQTLTKSMTSIMAAVKSSKVS
jgi:hypothetical protein